MVTSNEPFWAGTPVCVLGGSGFLGRHLVAQLLAAGARVRTLSLPGAPLESHPDLDARTGDMMNRVALADAVAGARVVFLAAGPVGLGPTLARRMGTHRAALDAVLAAIPVTTRLVLTSSLVAVGGTTTGAVLNESAAFPNAALRVNYVQAKRATEDAAVGSGRDVVVVNPGHLFGPDDFSPSVMNQLCVMFWQGRVPMPMSGGVSAADVRDVAAGHLLAAAHGVAGQRYILGGENLRLPELFIALAAAGGLRRAVRPDFRPAAPAWLMWAAATAVACATTLTRKENPLSFEMVRLNRLCWFVSSARAEAELGYRRRPLAETLADTFRWHAARGDVSPRGLARLWMRRVPPASV